MSPADTAKNTGTATAKEPADYYDDLSQDEMDAHDRIGSLGWKPEPAGRGFKAVKDGQEPIGPFPTLEELCEKVSNSVGNSDTVDEPADEPRKPKTHKLTKLPAGSTLQDVAVWSEIKGLGYSAEKDEDGLWTGYQLEGEDEIGTAETIGELRDMIKNQLIDHTEITIDVDPATQAPFLTGMEEKHNKQLANAIIAQHKAKMARVDATAEETKQNKNMAVVGTLHKGLYVPDPSQPGSKIYRVGKIISRIIHTEEEKFVTEKASSGMGEE
jgi:hypothetical protein